jgi:regulator of protease activity HflC (stomatin/prohibitin superfamily)
MSVADKKSDYGEESLDMVDIGCKNNEEHEDQEFHVEEDDRIAMMKPSLAIRICDILFCPLTCLFGWYCVSNNQEVIITEAGKYVHSEDRPGCHYWPCCLADIRKVGLRQTSVDLPTIKVLDSNGNPLKVSAILVYKVDRADRAVLSVADFSQYVQNQATATLRKIVSSFPYETDDGSPCLKTHLPLVSKRLKEAAHAQMLAAGARVITFQVNELSYSPEIAAAMLRRQQAHALVQARRTLVEGCTKIAMDSVKALEESDIHMTDSEKVRIIANMMVVTCSEGSVVPTLPMGE